MIKAWEEKLGAELEKREAKRLTRSIIATERAVEPVLVRNGRRFLNFSSNNYLGLANHPAIIEAIRNGAKRGAGATASRYIIGHEAETDQLEKEIAEWKGTEAALVFPNGYMANLGVLTSLLGRSDAVFSDRLNHASIVDGIRLSGAHHFRYRHGDLDHLESLLRKADEKGIQRKLIVTDSVFSMDGDQAPLQGLVWLKERHGAALMLDEAHASGVWGGKGEGLAHALGVERHVDIHMGTFSKAFGLYGAYVAGNRLWVEYIKQTCRPLIYTTGLPPSLVSGIRQALALVIGEQGRRERLHRNSEQLRTALIQMGLDLRGSSTQIIPLMAGSEEKALQFSKRLEEKGILAVAIRPPTVPEGTSRLRLSLMATHTKEHLRQVISTIKEVWMNES